MWEEVLGVCWGVGDGEERYGGRKRRMLSFFPRLRKLYDKITLEHTRTYAKKECDLGVEVAKDHEVIE